MFDFGTSGLLYQSSKLMYDHQTNSLWSTLQGRPVVGPLVNQNIQLASLPVVTTTWGEWKRRHPDSSVLSLETGYDRDYGEGVAYRDYFGTNALKYSVTRKDARMPNKAEVLALRTDSQSIALSIEFLKSQKLYHGKLSHTNFVVLTQANGASRVFACAENRFIQWNGKDQVLDDRGNAWTVTESAMRYGDVSLPRMPAHRAFWFGWFAQYPDTKLIQSPAKSK